LRLPDQPVVIASPSDAPVRQPGTRTRAGNAMGRTRAALLQATAECVERYGVRHTTMVDVASRGGVAKATLYNHFRTKGDLLAALVDSSVDGLVAAALTTATNCGPVSALAQAAGTLSASGPLRKAVTEEPGLVAPLLVPGSGRSWQVARNGVRALLAAGRLKAGPDELDQVLRWLVSHVAWPSTSEQAQSGASRLLQGLAGSPVPGPTATPAGPVPPVQPGPDGAGPAGLGWPGTAPSRQPEESPA